MSKGGHNPFLVDDASGFGSLPPSSGASADAREKTPLSSSSRSSSRGDVTLSIGGGTTTVPAEDRPSTSKPSSKSSASTPSFGFGGGGVSSSDPAPARPPRVKKTSWIFSPQYYQQYFDVDTDDVVARVVRAVSRPLAGDFSALCGDNPDLYGPFWICATLIFLNAMGGQYAVYLTKRRAESAADWGFDVGKIAASAGMFYGYVFFVPLALHVVFRCFAGVTEDVGLVQLICLYGYGLGVYVPVALFCIVPWEPTRWAAFLGGSALSAAFLASNLRPVASRASRGEAFATPLVGCAVGAHAVFGLLLKLFFFTSF